jgi:hypothetical protein
METSRSFRLHRFLRSTMPGRRSTLASGTKRLPFEREMRARCMTLVFQRGQRRFRSRRGRLLMACAAARFAGGRLPRPLASRFRRRRKLHTCAPSLRQSDGDGLFRRPRAVLPFTNVIDLFTNKFARLRRRSLPFRLVFSCAPQSFFLRHLRILRTGMKCIALAKSGARLARKTSR